MRSEQAVFAPRQQTESPRFEWARAAIGAGITPTPSSPIEGRGLSVFALAPVFTLFARFSPLQAAKQPPVMFSIFSPENVSNHLILMALSLGALLRFVAGGDFRPVIRSETGVEVRPAERPLARAADPRAFPCRTSWQGKSYPAGRAGSASGIRLSHCSKAASRQTSRAYSNFLPEFPVRQGKLRLAGSA